MGPECTADIDCANLNDACAKGVCSTQGICQQMLLPEGILCRPVQNACDVPEVCTGNSASCPVDLMKDKGYTYKCGLTQFMCGITKDDLSFQGNAYYIGNYSDHDTSCSIGTGSLFVDLLWPQCVSTCIPKICPPVEIRGKMISQGLSNYGITHCVLENGTWECDLKVDEISNFYVPYCPYP